jgi:MFS family permease
MRLIAPDILTEAKGLSPAVTGVFLAVGVMVWLLGWYYHRFWIVAGITAGAGLIGLYTGRAAGTQLLVVGLLLALAAGLLAMELARVLAFVGVGALSALAVRTVLPQGEPLIGFLVGGLLGVFLYRFWAMLLASFVGTELAAHAGLSLAEELGVIDAAKFAEQNADWITGVLIAASILGMFAQRWVEHYIESGPMRKKQKLLERLTQAERDHLKKMAPPQAPKKKPSLWGRLTRKAG